MKIRRNILLFSTTAALLLWGGRVSASGQQVSVGSRTTSIEKTIGVVSLNPTGYKKNSQLRFFNKDGSLWYQYSFNGQAGVPAPTHADFRPFAFHPDYFLLVLKCVKRDSTLMEVVVNESSGQTKFVRVKDGNLKFETWQNHVLRLFAVDFDQSENPIRSSPSLQGNSIHAGEKMTFRPIAIKGEWLRINWESSQGVRRRGGWIKWRNARSLLIEPFYMS